MYDQIRAWEQLDPKTQGGKYPRIFGLPIGRRYGKTSLRFLMRTEDCIRHPGSLYRISSAYQKNIDEIVNDVARRMLDTCPEDLRPSYLDSKQRYIFSNGSELRLVGLDLHPDGIRGRASDGDDIDEAAFVKGLRYAIKSVLYPQFQGISHARLFLCSSAPKAQDTEYNEFIADCKERSAIAARTIDDNPMLSLEEREEFIAAMGGREHPDCRREYYNEPTRDPTGSVVPEFEVMRHVVRHDVPKYAHCYVGADPGSRDKFGLVFAYYDHARGKLVVQRSWAKKNAGLAEVAEVVKSSEFELWGCGSSRSSVAPVAQASTQLEPATNPALQGASEWVHRKSPSIFDSPLGGALEYWDGKRLVSNPFRRVSDTDARTIHELANQHGVRFGAADKKHAVAVNDAGSTRKLSEAKLYALRNAFLNDQIEIWPNSGPLESQLDAGRWNGQRTDFERSEAHGHLDCLMALVYLLNAVQRHLNPDKPEWADADPRECYVPKHLQNPETHEIADLNRAFGVGGTHGKRFAAPRRIGGGW